MPASEIAATPLHAAMSGPSATGELHGGPGSGAARTRRPGPTSLALLAAAIAGALAWGWVAGSDARALRAMPPAARAELLQRTEANVRDLCLGQPDRPRAFCRAQAELLSSFDECQGACLAAEREELRADSALK
jgi:hypothetical protein